MSKISGSARYIQGGLYHRLSKQARFGQSRHEAKQLARAEYLKEHGNLRGFNPAKADGILSLGTMKTYRAAMRPFAVWLAENGVKNAAQITSALAGIYLKKRCADELSAYTISTLMSAINKALGFNLTKKELGLPLRRKSDIVQNRRESSIGARILEKNRDQIIIAKASGIRRASITRITALDCIRDGKGQVAGIRVREKGGRVRIAPILNVYKDVVTEIVDRRSNGVEPLFCSYSSRINSHRFRAEYCAALLEQLTQEHSADTPWFGGDLNPESYINLRGKDAKRGNTYRGYPTSVIAAVSGATGHNRLDIIFSSYDYMIPLSTGIPRDSTPCIKIGT